MKNKAFTLIELLAVIVVLGIIMLIAVTAVTGVINDSKQKAFKSTAMQVAKQVRQELLSTGDRPNTVNCSGEYYGLNQNNYESCTANIYFEGDQTNIDVDLVGKGSFDGLTTIGATMNSASVINDTAYSSLQTVLLSTVGGKDVAVNKYAGNGLYKWGSKYIYRGGITKTNVAGLATSGYAADTDSGSNPNNYVKVPWETYAGGETCTNATTNKCWRIVSINTDSSISIIRDRNESNQVFDNVVNTAARNYYSEPSINHGYQDFLSNVPTTGHPEEYRATSQMYTKLYGTTGYQNTNLKNYYYLLQPIDICLNKVNDYEGVNSSNYSTTTQVKDTCDIVGKTGTLAVNPLKNRYVRLPYLEEYFNVSLESTCTGDYQYQCRSQNFMYNKSTYWSLNGYSSYSWLVRYVDINGMANDGDAYNIIGLRPVVNLKPIVFITGGTGTTSDPYIIKS